MLISSKFFVEMEAAVDSSIKKWSKWTPWSGTCEVGTRIRSRICGNGHQCPIQLENTKHCSASNICMTLIIAF